MKLDEQAVRAELEALADEKYRKFAASLIPGCENMLGVRIPALRKLAKRIAKEAPVQYLEQAQPVYFEETMLKALIIGNMEGDIEAILAQAARFIPQIDNWSVCDSFCNELKIAGKHQKRVWAFLETYWHSDKPYEIRTAVVMLRFYFIDQTYLPELFQVLDSIKNENYYVKMAVAWAISMCFTHFPKETMAYLKDNRLDDFTYHKALQKIRESLCVDPETKETIKAMKREKQKDMGMMNTK